MTTFWIVAAVLAAGGLAFLLPPLWGVQRRERVIAAGAAAAFPLLVAAIYLATGTPAALGPNSAPAAGHGSPHAVTPGQVQSLVARLAERMRRTPEDTEGWIMLARSYAALGRYPDSAIAYERAAERLPNDAQLLADYADIAAMAQGRRLHGKPEELVRRALAADPGNLKALSLAGTALFEKGDYAGAAAQWRKILARVPAGSPIERSVRESIADAERRIQPQPPGRR